MRHFLIQVKDSSDGNWKTLGEVTKPATPDVMVKFSTVTTTDSIRFYMPGVDLKSDSSFDGFARVAELMLIMPDGQVKSIPKLLNCTPKG